MVASLFPTLLWYTLHTVCGRTRSPPAVLTSLYNTAESISSHWVLLYLYLLFNTSVGYDDIIWYDIYVYIIYINVDNVDQNIFTGVLREIRTMLDPLIEEIRRLFESQQHVIGRLDTMNDKLERVLAAVEGPARNSARKSLDWNLSAVASVSISSDGTAATAPLSDNSN